MSTDSFYGSNLNLNLPFTFDKTYPNFASAMWDIDSIFLGRYIFIRYTDLTETAIPDDFFSDDEKSIYAELELETTPGNRNWFIDKVYKKDEVNYHLTAWKKTVINGESYGYEMVGNFDITLPSIQSEVVFRSPHLVEELAISNEPLRAEVRKGNADKEYIITLPSAKAWDISISELDNNNNSCVDFYEEGFNDQVDMYDENITLNNNIINFEELSDEDKELGRKRLKIQIPSVGNTIAKTYNLIYGSNASGEKRPYYDFLSNEDTGNNIFGSLGACINTFQKILGRDNYIDAGSPPVIGNPARLDETILRNNAEDCFRDNPDLTCLLYHFSTPVVQIQNGITVTGQLCYVGKSKSSSSVEDIIVIDSNVGIQDGNWWFNFDSFIDLVLKGHAILSASSTLATTLEENGRTIEEHAKLIEDQTKAIEDYKVEVATVNSTFPGKIQSNSEGSEVFNLRVTSEITNATEYQEALQEIINLNATGYYENQAAYEEAIERVTRSYTKVNRNPLNTIADGVKYASAHGYYTSANEDYQTVVGCYNDTQNLSGHRSVFAVGCGDTTSRKTALSVGWTTTGTKIGDVIVNGQLSATKLNLGNRMSISNDTLETNGTIKIKPTNATSIIVDGNNSRSVNLGAEKNPFDTIYAKKIISTDKNSKFQGPVQIWGTEDTEVNNTKTGMLVLGSLTGNRMCLDENEIGVYGKDSNNQLTKRGLVIHASSVRGAQGTLLGTEDAPWGGFCCDYFRTTLWENKKYVLPKDKGTVRLGSTEYKWHSITAVTGVIQTSDIRYKDVDNSGKINSLLKMYDLLDPIAFTWKNQDDDKTLHIGLSAQQVEEKLKEVKLNPQDIHLVSKTNGEYSLNYGEFHGLHILKNHEQDKKIQELEERIKFLEQKIDMLLSK